MSFKILGTCEPTNNLREGLKKKGSNFGFWLNLVRPPPTWALLSGQFFNSFLKNLCLSNNKTVLLNTCSPSDIPWNIQTRLKISLKVLKEVKGWWEGGGGGT